mgnify:CR=1 FL=1
MAPSWNFCRRLARHLLRHSYRWRILYVPTRYQLPNILNARRLFGEGAEIGVAEGEFSEFILANWKGRRLYSIDPWMEFPRDQYEDACNVPQGAQDECYKQTRERLRPFGDRSLIVRRTSLEAAAGFQAGQLDFAYVDAQHHYEAVREDLALWYPKIRKGGILAGHDYLAGKRQQGSFGVKTAVDEFARARGLQLAVSAEKDWPSWFVCVR